MKKGTKHTPETRAIIKAKRALQTFSIETRQKMSSVRKGRKQSEEHKRKKGEAIKRYYDVVGRKTAEHIRIRMSANYKAWRKAVYERDNWTCQQCKARSSKTEWVILNADHIKPFAFFPELRFAIDNGVTLCQKCHRDTPTYGRNGRAKMPVEAFAIAGLVSPKLIGVKKEKK